MRLSRFTSPTRAGRLARCAAVALVVSVAALVPAAPASAAGGVVTSVTAVSETGDFVGAGMSRVFHPGNGAVWLSGAPDYLTVTASGGSLGDEFRFVFAAPSGHVLRPGDYVGAQRAPFRASGRPGLDVTGGGRGCNTVSGRFTVRDIGVTDGVVDRLHLLYEQHCDGGTPALFGEVRYRVPVSETDAVLLAPGEVSWPATYPGVGARPVPVTVRNSGTWPLTVGTPSISGGGADSFRVVSNGCTAPLDIGQSCVLFVRFVPTAAGPHAAYLSVPLDGSTGTVRLHGDGERGHTSWEMRGEPGEGISGGRAFHWTPADAQIASRGGESYVAVELRGPDGHYIAEFAPGYNEILLPGGRYENARRYPFHDRAPGLSVWGNGSACNTSTGTFTVHELAVGDYGLERFSASFVLRCDEYPAALAGSIAYKATEPAHPLPPVDAPRPAPAFRDIAGTTHQANIELVAARGIASGYPDDTFRPGEAVTRGQMAAFLDRAFELPDAPASGLSDTDGSVHAAAIDRLVASGIAAGYPDGRFRPGEPVSRGQMATFLDRALALPDAPPAGFLDTAGDAHAPAIDRVVAAGIASGVGDGTYRSREAVTRGQTATFLARSLSG